jgi:hypothetical protein
MVLLKLENCKRKRGEPDQKPTGGPGLVEMAVLQTQEAGGYQGNAGLE